MSKSIAFLHTAQCNADLFREMADSLPVRHSHLVRADLLARAGDAGRLTEEIRDETEAVLRSMTNEADAVVLTCSTLGPAADAICDRPVMRIDRALAEAAVAKGGRVAVLCTVETTIGPTGDLFREVAAGTGAAVEVRLIENVFQLFLDGHSDRYFEAIASAADEIAPEFDVVAFGQASMAPAVALCRVARPLTSTDAGMAAAYETVAT